MLFFYAIDSVGLGHLSRTLGIAQAITNILPDYPIGFITEATDARLLEQYPYAFYQVPNRDSLFNSVRWQAYPPEFVLDAWVGIIDSILKAYKPDLFVFDTYIWPEVQKLTQSLGIKQILIMRKQNNLVDFFQKNYQLIKEFDLITFPHTQNELPGLIVPPALTSKVYFSGPILRRSVVDLDNTVTRISLGLEADKFLITVSNGGGNALLSKDDNFLEVVINALRMAQPYLPDFQIIIVKGPLSKQNIALYDLPDNLNIREYEPKLLELYSLSNIVISRGGYNTILELMQIEVPAICIPAKRELDDQAQRIAFAQSTTKNICFAPLDPMALTKEVVRIAGQPVWKFGGHNKKDDISDNKQKLARKILSLVNR